MENKKINDEFWKQVHREAAEFRHHKMKEIFSKEKPEESDIAFLNAWAELFGEEI